MSELSICIPSYNYAHYLNYAIDSCLACNRDFELIVLDNFSSDSTPELKERYIGDKRVKWVRNDSLLPVQKNWNKAVSLTSGKYVKLLQADDVLLPDFFDIFEDVNKYNKKNAAIIGHLAVMIDSEGEEIRKQNLYGRQQEYYVNGIQAVKLKLQNISRFKEPSCNFFRKDAWEKVGGYRDDLRFVFDIYFNTLMAYNFGGILINKYGAGVRRHAASDGAKLPPQLAITELEFMVNSFNDLLFDNLTKKDKENGFSMIQYRIIELFLQKIKSNPIKSLKFLLANSRHFYNVKSLFITFETLKRKLLTGDVQKKFESGTL